MPELTIRDELWSAAHVERAALANDLATLTDAQWKSPALCGEWTVEQVVAHMTASASIGTGRWFRSVIGARFDFDLHNARRLAEHLGATPAETLERFRAITDSTTSAPGPAAAWLGEVVVHSADIRRPLGLSHVFPIETTSAVARFYASRNLAVPTRTNIAGLRVEATDGPFRSGDGPLVQGTTLALIMAMAGRSVFCDDLTGPGVATLRARLANA
jgi:uncharacterized protein (TIGR03083 family)